MLDGRISGEFLYNFDKVRMSEFKVRDRKPSFSEVELHNIQEYYSDFYSLVYIYNADAMIYINGYEFIAPKNSMVVVDRYSTIISCMTGKKRAKTITLDFKPELFGRVREENPDFDKMLKYIMHCNNSVDVELPKGYYVYDLDKRLEFFFKESLMEYKHRKINYMDILRGHIRTLLIEIARDLHCFDEIGVKDELVQQIVDFCEIHCTEKITIEQIAERFNYSKPHITRVCKKELGMSFAEFVRQKRIYKACCELERTDHKVYDIAKMVGFNDIPHFTECFKKYVGMSPGEYRKSRRKTHKWFVGMEDLKTQKEMKSKMDK